MGRNRISIRGGIKRCGRWRSYRVYCDENGSLNSTMLDCVVPQPCDSASDALRSSMMLRIGGRNWNPKVNVRGYSWGNTTTPKYAPIHSFLLPLIVQRLLARGRAHLLETLHPGDDGLGLANLGIGHYLIRQRIVEFVASSRFFSSRKLQLRSRPEGFTQYCCTPHRRRRETEYTYTTLVGTHVVCEKNPWFYFRFVTKRPVQIYKLARSFLLCSSKNLSFFYATGRAQWN